MSRHEEFLQLGPKTYQCKRCPEVVTERLTTRADARLAHADQTDTEETP